MENISMRVNKLLLLSASLVILLGSFLCASTTVRQIQSGAKAIVRGTILSRHGDLVLVRERRSGNVVVVELFEDTKFERRKGRVEFFRHKNMDATAMLPGLTIEAEGVGNAQGQLEAKKVAFRPDMFAIGIAEEKQIMENQAAAQQAQSTADQGVGAAREAQSSANRAQSSADDAGVSADDARRQAQQADADAQAADDLAVVDAEAVRWVNKRVSDLDRYKTVAETTVYFANGQADLDGTAKQRLDELAAVATSLDIYMIEIAGYASSPGARKLNQKVSEDRAAAVAQYLREEKHVPIRRILAPAGYGATRALATKADPADRPLDRSVDVKVLVNQAFAAGL
jgi:outer membrane protein OmpA-like peptidoglycan-associated protein